MHKYFMQVAFVDDSCNIFLVFEIQFHIVILNNNYISDMLLRSRGNYIEAQIDRCSKMARGFGKEVSRLFAAAMYNEGGGGGPILMNY